jgi:hypothetical protein
MANKKSYVPVDVRIVPLNSLSVLLVSNFSDNDGSWAWGESAL